MATFAALMFSALAVAVDSLDVNDLVNNTNLSMYQDPSKFIWTNSSVYLSRISVSASTLKNTLQTPCVRSRYWSNTTKEVERSLDVYNKTEHSNIRSTNISLTVEDQDSKKILNVQHNGSKFSIMNITDKEIAISNENNTFRVLYSDTNCLILADTLKAAGEDHEGLRCWMWLPESRIQKPPKCCLFVFELLCSYFDETVEVSDKSCLNTTERGSKSG
ncbi:uncharacterized protein LOC119383881 [Rhipicephalus sanguineus]|uniref:uncharacterized protein LOC119383881 n=1 Tax=Rhipicephalus sanguineus TaxID=34632 RepID=UPI0020C2D6E6|nr:uncharacterized protein LOC119383881 [Rhipicephalus sanguineus]